MIKLLTTKENLINCVNVYNEDYTCFTVEGEPKGTTKQVSCDWMDETDYFMLNQIFKKLGLDEYIETCLHEDKLIMRIIEEN